MTASLHLQKLLDEPEALTGLPEALCAFPRHTGTILRDLKKFLLSDQIRAVLRFPLCQRRITFRVADHGCTAHNHRLQEAVLRGVIRIPHLTAGQLFCRLPDDAGKAFFQHLVIMHGHMAHTVVKIVSGGKHVVFHGLHRFRRHIGKCQLTVGFPLPVGMYLSQPLLGLLRNIKGIRRTFLDGIELRLQPLPGILREGLTASGGQR